MMVLHAGSSVDNLSAKLLNIFLLGLVEIAQKYASAAFLRLRLRGVTDPAERKFRLCLAAGKLVIMTSVELAAIVFAELLPVLTQKAARDSFIVNMDHGQDSPAVAHALITLVFSVLVEMAVDQVAGFGEMRSGVPVHDAAGFYKKCRARWPVQAAFVVSIVWGTVGMYLNEHLQTRGARAPVLLGRGEIDPTTGISATVGGRTRLEGLRTTSTMRTTSSTASSLGLINSEVGAPDSSTTSSAGLTDVSVYLNTESRADDASFWGDAVLALASDDPRQRGKTATFVRPPSSLPFRADGRTGRAPATQYGLEYIVSEDSPQERVGRNATFVARGAGHRFVVRNPVHVYELRCDGFLLVAQPTEKANGPVEANGYADCEGVNGCWHCCAMDNAYYTRKLVELEKPCMNKC